MKPRFEKQTRDAESKLALAYPHVREWGTAIDGGASLGAWSILLATRFQSVHAFEPFPSSLRLLEENVKEVRAITVHGQGLGDRCQRGHVVFDGKHYPHVEANEAGDMDMVSVDSLSLTQVGFIKLDLEGGEYDAIQGARETIRRDRPVLIIEIAEKKLPSRHYGRRRDAALSLLMEWGATVAAHVAPDYVCYFQD